MLSAIAGKNGLASGVSLVKLRWFVQQGQNGQTSANKADAPKANAASTEAESPSLSGMAGASSVARPDGEGTDGRVGSSAPVVAVESAADVDQLGADGMAALRAAVTEVRCRSMVVLCSRPNRIFEMQTN